MTSHILTHYDVTNIESLLRHKQTQKHITFETKIALIFASNVIKDYFSFSSLFLYAFVFIFLVDSFCNCVFYSYSFSKKNTVIKKLLIKNRDLAHCSLSRFYFYFLHVVFFFFEFNAMKIYVKFIKCCCLYLFFIN